MFVDAPLELCEQRDPKGLYARARAGELAGLTGVGAPYEPPENPDLVLGSDGETVEQEVERVMELLSRARHRLRHGSAARTAPPGAPGAHLPFLWRGWLLGFGALISTLPLWPDSSGPFGSFTNAR